MFIPTLPLASTKMASILPISSLACHSPRFATSMSSHKLRAPHTLAAKSVAAPPQRRSAMYPPTLWKDSYLQSLSSGFPGEHVAKIEELKKGVRRLIVEDKAVAEQLELVDVLQQLGLEYHFEEEISDVLAKLSVSTGLNLEHDLYTTAQLFRLLRHQGFTSSPASLEEVFNSFKDETGSFKASLCHDPKGLLSLYQASYYAMEGEKTMDEARYFTATHLTDFVEGTLGSSDRCLVEHVNYSLLLPLIWRFSRIHSRWFIERYKSQEKMNPILLELAKLDFNKVQSKQKAELKDLSRWWSDLDLAGAERSFMRDRLVESYVMSVGWNYEPRLWRTREAQTKNICLISAIDDMYDVYGTLDELELFTVAVQRWEVTAIDQLPEYMKICYLALFNTMNNIAYKILRDKGVDIVPYLKKAWAGLCKAYLVEARWYHTGYTPTLDEYLENAWVSITGPLCLTVAYCVNEDISIKALKHMESFQDMAYPSSMLYRLYDDLGTSTEEIERGDVPKSIQCYMHEKGISETMARDHIRDLTIIHWKGLNGLRSYTSPLEKVVKNVALNFLRTSHFFYEHGDGYGTNVEGETKDHINSLFFKPIML